MTPTTGTGHSRKSVPLPTARAEIRVSAAGADGMAEKWLRFCAGRTWQKRAVWGIGESCSWETSPCSETTRGALREAAGHTEGDERATAMDVSSTFMNKQGSSFAHLFSTFFRDFQFFFLTNV